MILDDLKNHVIKHPHCTQASLAQYFSLSEDGIDAMMSIWRKKGQLKTTLTKEKGVQICRYLWLKENEIGLTVIFKSS